MKPKLHFTAPQNWINDPNGLIYYQGKYHIFYQHFPYTCQWGTMHWGHAVSDDLMHFEHLPIALYPSKIYDRNGCFSGSAIEWNQQLYLYYTSIRYAKENPEYVHVQYSDDDLIASQAVVISEDGYTFDNKDHKHQVIDVISDASLGDVRHTRDPKVWIGKNNHIYMILGSKIPYGDGYAGEVLFYESEDGLNFHYKNRFVDETIGDMWECPDLFELDGQYYLVFSPEHINKPPQPVSNAVIMAVNFDEETCTLTRQSDYVYLDYGLDFYAPQTFIDEYKNRVMFGWMRMREPGQGENWIGMYTYPRVLTQKDGHVYQNVHPYIQEYFNTNKETIDFQQPFLLQVSMNKESYLNLGGLKLWIEDDALHCSREDVSIQHEKVCQNCQTPHLNEKYDLNIYYDHHIFEIYINDGYYVLSQVVYDLTQDIQMQNIDYIVIKGHE